MSRWIEFLPRDSRGAGRPKDPPRATLYAQGENRQFVVNHAAMDLMGHPRRVRMKINPQAQRIRLFPTTPDDAGGWTLSGGGNTQHRITARRLVTEHPELVGRYTVHKIRGGVELRKENES